MSDRPKSKTLNLYPIDYPFETLVSRIASKDPKLILNPDFQRKYKWDKEGWERASKFIESCLMRIPLPSCYFAEDQEGRHIVIDGVQRLTTIVKYFQGEFALEGMTAFKEIEGKRFSEIGDFKQELETTTIRCIVLRKENEQPLIREIFSRLNQGSVTLSNQEIRHALYPGCFDDMLKRLAELDAIKNFGKGPNSETPRDSLEAEELALRFFAFNRDLSGYGDNLSKFLDEYMASQQGMSKEGSQKLEEKFLKALNNCIYVFKDDVFRGVAKTRNRQSIVYYDLLMHSFSDISPKLIKTKAANIRQAFAKLCNSTPFKRTLSGGLQGKIYIGRRREMWAKLLEKSLK